MNKFDAIIVGGGISGLMLAWRWHLNGKHICLIADSNAGSSHVAAGVFNPVVLKRFTPVWNASNQVEALQSLSISVEAELGSTVFHRIPIYRRFHNEKEKAAWVKKSKREELIPFMGEVVDQFTFDGLTTDHGIGITNHTGFLDCATFIQKSLEFFATCQTVYKEHFDWNNLLLELDKVQYDDFTADHLICCEGFKLDDNPYFDFIELQGNKGETLIVEIPNLNLDFILKGAVFVMPMGNNRYWVGATYSREYADAQPTQQGLDFLESKLKQLIDLPYKVIKHTSGIRPTTHDRRPIVGTHHRHKRLHIFNGMGSRAVLITPWASQQLFNNIYKRIPIPSEMDAARCYP